jgi:bacterioferritin-associated ferredoxin/NifU-like protein involved in Fe-S cluster formation
VLLPHEGPLPTADLVGVCGSVTSGPGVRIALALRGDDDVVAEARFETFALDAARPVADALCAAIVGATLDDASRVSLLDVARMGGVAAATPAARLTHFAKSAALQPRLGRRARHGASLTCTCFQVPTAEIVATIRRHRVRTVEDLKAHLPVTTGCGTCRPDVQRLLDAERRGDPGSA